MGNMHGKGTLQFDRDGQNYYTGDFICNVPFGRGRRQYASGNLYEGMWINGQRHGFGIFSWSNGNGEYTGQWEHGVQVCYSPLWTGDMREIRLERSWHSCLVHHSSRRISIRPEKLLRGKFRRWPSSWPRYVLLFQRNQIRRRMESGSEAWTSESPNAPPLVLRCTRLLKGNVIFRNGTMIEADFAHDRITTPLTNEMTSMLQIELPEIRSKTPIPSGTT